jgi:hypothetical protein
MIEVDSIRKLSLCHVFSNKIAWCRPPSSDILLFIHFDYFQNAFFLGQQSRKFDSGPFSGFLEGFCTTLPFFD